MCLIACAHDVFYKQFPRKRVFRGQAFTMPKVFKKLVQLKNISFLFKYLRLFICVKISTITTYYLMYLTFLQNN